MHDKILKAQDVILAKVNSICNKFGLNNIMAQLYTILYFSNKPLSLDDMVERLKISKGSASINIRALEGYGAVRRVWVKGSRRDYYEAEVDIARVITERIRSMANSRMSEVGEMIDVSTGAIKSIGASDQDEEIRVFEERLESLKSLYGKARQLFELFNMSFSNQSVSAGSIDNGKETGA